jgi:hypothetical protein
VTSDPAFAFGSFATELKSDTRENVDHERVHGLLGARAIVQPSTRRAWIGAGKLGEALVGELRTREPDELAERNFSFPRTYFFADIFVRSEI